MDDHLLQWGTLTSPPRKASIGIGPNVVPGTADCIGLCFRAEAATGSLYDIVSDYSHSKIPIAETKGGVDKAMKEQI